MNRGIRMIKKSTIILIFLVFPIVAKAEPYKPYPILFVHGLGASSGTWGAGTYIFGDNRTDSLNLDSIPDGGTYDHFLDYMTKYSWAWYDWEKEQGLEPTYTPADTQARFPNKTFLEVINFDDNRGSIARSRLAAYRLPQRYWVGNNEYFRYNCKYSLGYSKEGIVRG